MPSTPHPATPPPHSRLSRPSHRRRLASIILITLAHLVTPLPFTFAATLIFPTDNDALLHSGREERFFAPTPGKSWTSGCFGCVRSDGFQFHEGIDILTVKRRPDGEPTDPVLAVAPGTVVYCNQKPGLSNYGRYVVIRHAFPGGLEVYSLYAHLSEITPTTRPGAVITQGARIGTLGRSTNTRQRIGKDRAHLHFELGLLLQPHFTEWFRTARPGERNDHGEWNGQNLAGINPAEALRAQSVEGPNFQLLPFIKNQTALCRVQVRKREFFFLRRYPQLLYPNPAAQRDGIAGYEIALTFNGLPFALIPRSEREMKSKARIHLVTVNADELSRRPCGKLVTKAPSGWQLTDRGTRLIELLIYR